MSAHQIPQYSNLTLIVVYKSGFGYTLPELRIDTFEYNVDSMKIGWLDARLKIIDLIVFENLYGKNE